MELPSYDKDHYELDNCEETHKEFPDSYRIPERELRDNLKCGDLVKLVFRMQEKENTNVVSVERMWVEVQDKVSGVYISRLDNDPLGDVHVKCGQTVYFKAEHVNHIHEDENT